ncbi:hypothetical protein FBU31_000921 [Coemansia sp. 'formosensis']|nr:hypothetical protein FBU31_000921 [Coemansia sp. 'formosensis']
MPSIDLMLPVTIDNLNIPMVADNDGIRSIAVHDLKFDENLAGELEQGLEELKGEEEEEDKGNEEEEEEEDDKESNLYLDMGNQPISKWALQMHLLEEEITGLKHTVRK